jgi:predicted membrane metal-binding protein
MKKWIWLLVLILAALCVVGSKSFLVEQRYAFGIKLRLSQPVIDTIRVDNPTNSSTSTQQKLAAAVSSPQVSRERLLTHLQKLNFQR